MWLKTEDGALVNTRYLKTLFYDKDTSSLKGIDNSGNTFILQNYRNAESGVVAFANLQKSVRAQEGIYVLPIG